MLKRGLQYLSIALAAVGSLAADVWLFKMSGLSARDAGLLDIPVTVGFLVLGAVGYSLAGGKIDQDS